MAVEIRALDLQVFITGTVMNTLADKQRLAERVLNAGKKVHDRDRV